MKQLINSRRAIHAGGAGLLLGVIALASIFCYIGYKEGWYGGTTSSSGGMFSYYDQDLKQTLYFKTAADRDAYIQKKYPGGIPGTGEKYPLSGKVICLDNLTVVASVTVEIFTPTATADYWQGVESATTDANGDFTGKVALAIGSRVMVHVQRSATKYIYDRWVETVVPAKGGGLATTCPIGSIEVAPYPRATPTVSMQLGNGTSISTTVASPTPLSKANGGATQSGARAQLIIGSEAWCTYGANPWTQWATSKGHEKREYVTIATVNFNVSGVNWLGDSEWKSVSVTSGSKWAKILRSADPALASGVPTPIIRTKTSTSNAILIGIAFDLSGLSNNVGVAVTVQILDYQLFEQALRNTATSTVGTDGTRFGFTYTVTATFQIVVRA